ncbi:MAG: peptidoglycan editing factor PgeF [Alphaproteobacteria bacterium]
MSDEDLPYLTSDALSAATGVTHAFFTRKGGVSKGIYATLNTGYGSKDDSDLVRENRGLAAGVFGLQADDLVTLYQVHSADCVVVENNNWMLEGEAPQADAMVTVTQGVALGVCTADCAPVLFADRKGGVVGAAHAGWKGAFTGILESTVEAMVRLGSKKADIVAAIGPCIARSSYEVGAEFKARFMELSPVNEEFFVRADRRNHHKFDLEGYAAHRLKLAGLTSVDKLSRDTRAEEDLFFSYRRCTLRDEDDYGRQISAIALDG